MKVFLIVMVMSFSFITAAQTMREIDSVSFEMCNNLEKLKISNDTLLINTFYNQQLIPYLSEMEPMKAEKIGTRLFFRLQRNCITFHELLNRLEPPVGWEDYEEGKPVSEISKKELDEFKSNRKFYYFEGNGDTTFVEMEAGRWTDSFTDGTQSHLTYEWSTNDEFQLTFIRSDNLGRSNLSIKGDIYNYQVVKKEKDYFVMALNIPGQKLYQRFNLHIVE